MQDVVVATRPLGIGVMVKPADVKLTKVSMDSFPKGAFSKVEEVLDRPVVSNILLDEPLLEGRLAVKGSGLGLAPTIPVGMRAVTVRVNDVAGAAGFVLPGLKVDVLVTGHPPTGESNMTTTVLQNVLVLSAGQAMQSDARGTLRLGIHGDLAGDAERRRNAHAGQRGRSHSVNPAQLER